MSEYTIRKERAIARGISPRIGVGHPPKGEPGIQAQRLAGLRDRTKAQSDRLMRLLQRPARDLGITLHEAWTRFVASPVRARRP